MTKTEIIRNEVNTLRPFGKGYAPISIGNPGRTHPADLSTFKKSMDEKWKLFNLKKATPKKQLVLIGRYQF